MTHTTDKQTPEERERANKLKNFCACPPSHAHAYVGRCRWSFHWAGAKHICQCVIPPEPVK